MRVYHLTGAEHALSNLRHRRIKIARIEDLNDPFELRSISSTIGDVRRALELTRSQLVTNRGMLCFSAGWKNPVLWSHYGDRHRGIALGFDVATECLARVRYKPRRTPYDPGLMSPGGRNAEAAVLNLLTTKYTHWRYEDEWRAFLTLSDPDPETGKYFADFSDQISLREVIVGAASSVSRADVASALGDLATAVRTFRARLAFKSFTVVRQKKESLWL
jgi:hypothetical protein